jgi:hypothetical protein
VIALAGLRTAALGEAPAPPTDEIATLAASIGHDPQPVHATVGAIPLDDAPDSALIVPGGGRSMTDAEIGHVEAFADAGGTVLLTGPPALARALGTPVHEAPITPIDASAESIPVQATVDRESFDVRAPAALAILDVDQPGPPNARTGNRTFLDLDGDGRETDRDRPGPFPVADTPRSNVLVLATPGLASEPDRADNRAFLATVLQTYLPRQGTVYVDASRGAHLVQAPAKASLASLAVLSQDARWGLPVLVGGLAATVGALTGSRDPERDEETLETARPWPRRWEP